jgi:hypothetical protein
MADLKSKQIKFPLTGTSVVSSSAQIATDISGSFVADSGSFSTRITTDSGSFSTRVTTAETELTNTLVSSSAQIATDISGSFVADSGSFSSRITTDSGSFSTRVTTAETELSNTLVSSSAQIATDISGSFVADSGSFSTRVTTAETELSNTLVSSSAQIATDISGSFVAASGSFSTRVTTAETELTNTLVSSSAQIATDISGSFVAPSASFSTRVTTEEGNVDTLQARDLIAGAGLTGGGTLAADRTFTVGAGTGVTVNANDVAIGQAVATTSNVKFNHITGSGNISGSLGNILGFDSITTVSSGSFGTNLGVGTTTPAESLEVIGAISASTSGSFLNLDVDKNINTTNLYGTILTATQATIDHDSLANFVADEHVVHGDVSVIAGTGLTGGGTIAANRTLNVIGGDGITANANDIAITAAQTTITSVLAEDLIIGEDAQTKIDFETANEIHLYADNAEQVYVADGIFGPETDSDVDLGTTGVRFKDAYIDTITTTATSSLASIKLSGESGHISGSLGVIKGFALADITDITNETLTASGTSSLASIKLSGESAHLSGSLGVITGFAQANITSASLDYVDVEGDVTASKLYGTVGTATQGTIDHDSLANFVADEHVVHGDVSVIAGTGLTGGGTIAANRTLNVIGGTGVTANANDMAIGQDVATDADVEFATISTTGNITAQGDIIAENYIVSSSVTYMTSSAISGSSLFGDTQDDTHQFTGSVFVTGSTFNIDSIGSISSSASGSFLNASITDNISATNFHGQVATAAQTGINSILATDLVLGEDAQTKIDFETANEIHFYANNVEQVYLADNIFGPQSDSDVDLGTTGVRWKDAFVDSVTSTGSGSFAHVAVTGEGGQISGSQSTLIGFKNSTITSGSFSGVLGVGTALPKVALEVIGAISGSTSGSFLNVDITDNLGVTGKFTLPNITDVSASIAAAVAGGDNMGNHTATQDLDMDGNDIFDVQHISSSGNISGSKGSILGFDSGSFNTNLGIGTLTPAESLEVIGAVSASTSGSFLNIKATNNVNATNLYGTVLTATQATIDHDSLANFVGDEHVVHGDVSVIAGTGLTGGGTIAANRTLNVVGGDGITANANDIAITAAQTTITSIYAEDLLIGEDAQTKIDFETANEIHFDVNNIETFNMAGLQLSGSQASTGSFGSVVTDANVGIGVANPKESLEVIGSISGSASGSFLNIDAPHILATNVHGTVLTATQATIDHDSLANFVADEHVVHGDVSVIAGTGLTGGGTIAANRTLNVIGGNGITANANDIAITPAQTTITSVLATDIKIGEDDQTKIDFETANEIHFYANNVEQVYLADNIFGPQSDSDVDLGTTGVRWKDAFVDNITTTATGSFAHVAVSGEGGQISGSQSTLIGFAQADITSGSLDYVNVTGNVTASTIETSGDVIAFGSSDRELKDNIQPITNPLEKLNKIGGYTFIWNDKQSTYKGKDIGVVAQEIQSVLPEIVASRANGYLGVKYEKIVTLLIESIKELNKKIKHIEENCECLNK